MAEHSDSPEKRGRERATLIRGSVRLFYAYARKDERLRAQLETHLAALKREGLLTDWHDQQIAAGSLWKAEISRQLESADIILLLVSAHFLASDYCYSVEMQRALARAARGEARVIPVLLSPADWQSTPLGQLQVLPANGKPITSWSDRAQALASVVQSIRQMISAPAPLPNSSTEQYTGEAPTPKMAAIGARTLRIGRWSSFARPMARG